MKTYIVLAAAAFSATVGLAPMASATTNVAADWEMNESYSASTMESGPTVMHDSTGNHNGTIPRQDSPDGQQITTHGSYYSWKDRCPACYPPDSTRVIQVPDSSALEIPDPSVPYTLTFRFRTSHPFGNYMQKGQATTPGGQIKVQAPKGNVQCLFHGSLGQVGTGSTQKYPALDDGQWHTVTCVHTSTQVKEYVDNHTTPIVKNGSTGPIDNSYPMTIGGKPKCDQVKVTCDYFSGDMDFVRVSHG
jgi:FlaG/FlaF family flagellin (archaellin)